ncbi:MULTISPECIES: MOSC domain-containing protein [unclassified Ensifer]|uniref:MOSC domain-containing protein n=1 Tax=unclassified Ensifer TaxID=2633371 RepID=UPI0008133DCE|nr:MULTISPECIES: MOSC domain-containing protein [unclassified Ensifer]OCO98175.1 sulfurase [Ensifer sp. LC14]OCP03817.1 sulfurase [Ensifer sp. LC11]OCP04209.1 sulfurase [Ensifer sp. LC13]OCP30347.1 sulfurase [Ensifer sp. LC499]
MKVTGLNIHPLKSGRAIAREAVVVNLDGFEGDRRFMLVEPDGRFITQRELQSLAQVEATHIDGGVHLKKGGDEISVRFDPDRRQNVVVWGSEVDAAVSDDTANVTLSAWFGRPVKLAHMDASAERLVGADWAGTAAPVGFADGFPILITTTGSLADLNRTLADKGQDPVGMDRFRTNILIDCDGAWEEDFWESVEIGGIVFDLVKPCARCIMTTQDQITGERIGGNPIQGLAEKRMSSDRRVAGVLFGWNAVPRKEGTLKLGDEVKVIGRRAERWPMKVRASA